MSTQNISDKRDSGATSHVLGEYIIEVLEDGVWSDCGEGPFSSLETAVQFGDSEVGNPWRVLQIVHTGEN
jgi:hypothetical protein